MENYGTNLSPTFNKNYYLVPWIGEQQYIEMLVWHFSIHPEYVAMYGQLPEQHFNVWLFSNPEDNILILAKNLRVVYLRGS